MIIGYLLYLAARRTLFNESIVSDDNEKTEIITLSSDDVHSEPLLNPVSSMITKFIFFLKCE